MNEPSKGKGCSHEQKTAQKNRSGIVFLLIFIFLVAAIITAGTVRREDDEKK
jgi:hypothetical protein